MSRVGAWWGSWRVPLGVRSAAAGLLGLAGAAYFLQTYGGIQPVKNWFFWDLATIWFWNLVLSAACVSLGLRVVRWLLPASERTPLEALALAFPTGVVLFVLGMYAAGFLHLWSSLFAVLFAVACIAVGARSSLEAWREARDAARSGASGLPVVVQVFGVLLVGLLYLGVLAPESINYDATWVHMVIPQDYARAGHVVAFPGDQVKNVPHLGGVLSTWSFLVPGLALPQLRWIMAMHTEFTVLLWTLVGIAAGARWLAEQDVPGTWVALLLFPGIFVYDGNLGGASDHFLALFAVPMVFTGAKLAKRFDRSVAALCGLMMGGALATKYQAIYVLGPLSLFIGLRGLLLILRRLRGNRETPPLGTIALAVGTSAGIALLVLLPHLVSNWVFYRNPLYPLLQDLFKHSTPSFPDAAEQVSRVLADWRWKPPAALDERIKTAFKMAFTFSFEPHYSFVSNLPVFGSTFTLALPLLFVIERSRRLWFGALMGVGAAFAWAMAYWVDRNLQTFLPILVAATAAILVRAWRTGWLARVGVVALVTVQLAWALPLYFSGSDRIGAAINLLRGGMQGQSHEQLKRFRGEYVAMGKSLPEDAVILLHNQHLMLGINRPAILDWVGFQTIVDYRLFKTTRDLYDRFKQIGVTHIEWIPGWFPAGTVQEEVVFNRFIREAGGARSTFGNMSLMPMPPPPPRAPIGLVLTISMPEYKNGLYQVEALSACRYFPADMQHPGKPVRSSGPVDELMKEAKVVVVGSGASLAPAASERLSRDFKLITSYPEYRLYFRD